MKFLIDENVRSEVEIFLAESGHDVKRVASGARNGEIIQSALAEKRALITHDVHFSNILMYPPEKYCGIIRIRIDPPSADKITLALKGLLDKTPSEQFDKRLFVLEEDGFRAR